MKSVGAICLWLVFGVIQCCYGQNIPAKPNPSRLVNDFTNTLTSDQQAALEHKLVAFDDSTSTQIAVIIIESLEGADISDLALKIGRGWGIGGKEYNNGVVFLIAKGDRKMNISTGYGVEGALPDITAKHIIDDVVKPNFKGNDYYRGIDEGTNAIIKAVKGEYQTPRKKAKGNGSILILVMIVIILVALSSGRGGGGSMMSGSGRRGFGGGSFGGGGASGGW